MISFMGIKLGMSMQAYFTVFAHILLPYISHGAITLWWTQLQLQLLQNFIITITITNILKCNQLQLQWM